ncbi:1-acyl-sn-glycerol-3-phosphate acyltransferase [Actinacidiphila acidipaludis]|uniref:1-acyl-sn-glycerol-3-phosphate acyltransferase n=1 Tax=Actinacidiphila acidipaludis TaxID=2873382 RepID=UPI0027E006E7|nr:1-acyl-sn-glycerol-3-phosphate acyltransferase [Streptomyces acidipaludis]
MAGEPEPVPAGGGQAEAARGTGRGGGAVRPQEGGTAGRADGPSPAPPRTPVAAAAAAAVTIARRTATVTVLLALIPVAAVVLVAATVLTAPVSLVTRGPWRPARMAAFVLLYLLADLAGVLAATGSFLRHPRPGPAGRERRATHAFALLARLLTMLRRVAQRLFRLEVRITPALPPAAPDAPLVVLMRHAGLGDSFLLLQILLAQAQLRPFTVLKGLLRLDPCLDVLLGRVPHCFLPPARGSAAQAVAELAARLRPGDALVIFPEGGNFTPGRHHRAVARLRRLGQYRRAARAARLHYVLPPRDTGSLAALAAAPGADVVFVAHAGLDVIASPRAAWSFLPLPRRVRVHWWRVPAADIPHGDDARSEWLLGQWERMDAWTAAQAVPATPHV